jgi:hypothetical protein
MAKDGVELLSREKEEKQEKEEKLKQESFNMINTNIKSV